MNTPFFACVMAIVSKDLRGEMRSRELLSVMALFALLSVLVFSFALELDRVARAEAVSGVLWVTLIFASVLGLNRSLSLESNLDALLLAPVSRSAIFVGKLAGNAIFTAAVGLALLPLMTALYGMNLLNIWVIVTTIVGIFGICTIGTLLATMTVQTRAREALLADSAAAGGAALLADGGAGFQRYPGWRVRLASLAATAVGDYGHLSVALFIFSMVMLWKNEGIGQAGRCVGPQMML